jgi:hypothetical protein
VFVGTLPAELRINKRVLNLASKSEIILDIFFLLLKHILKVAGVIVMKTLMM